MLEAITEDRSKHPTKACKGGVTKELEANACGESEVSLCERDLDLASL